MTKMNQLLDYLEGKIYEVDFKGHFSKKEYADFYSKKLHLTLYLFIRHEPYITKVLNGETFDPIKIEHTSESCPTCSEWLSCSFDGKTIRINEEECKYPNGLPDEDWTINLKIPSGTIIYGDSLPKFDIDRCFEGDKHLSDVIKESAKQNFVTMFVGNSCPSIIKTDNGFQIGNCLVNKNFTEEDEEKFLNNKLGRIITDLWWITFTDFNEFTARNKHITPKRFLTVEPGTYQFKYNPKNVTLESQFYCHRSGSKEQDEFKPGWNSFCDISRID